MVLRRRQQQQKKVQINRICQLPPRQIFNENKNQQMTMENNSEINRTTQTKTDFFSKQSFINSKINNQSCIVVIEN